MTSESRPPSVPGLRRWLLVFCACFVVSMGIPVWYATWDVTSYAHHACEALEVLTSTPVHAPANPSANPSRVQVYHLYEGLIYWEDADGCK